MPATKSNARTLLGPKINAEKVDVDDEFCTDDLNNSKETKSVETQTVE